MSISERLSRSCRFVTGKILWIIAIPIVLDLINLFSFEKMYHTVYYPVQKLFMIKFGFMGAPPSVSFILEDFPSPLFKYDNNGISGLLNRFSLFNAGLFITVLLVISFLKSGYMSILGTSIQEKVRIKDFFIKGNRRWHKFFLLNCITWFPLILVIFNRNFIFLTFISIIFVYVEYSFVTDEVSILQNFKLGIAFLFNNLGLSVKMALYFGIIFSLLSLIVFPLSRLGNGGIIIDIIICAYAGAVTNRTVLEVYSSDTNSIGKEPGENDR